MMSSRYSVRRCNSGSRYSSFNMGAGEDLLITLLYILQNCPDGSLIVVEEIETGLFPEALIRLSETLQEIILRKRLQIIVSTHSHYFIDSVPRQARILLRRVGDEHCVIPGPTTLLAMGDMSGRSEPELQIYCEDDFAKLLIEQALPLDLRRRVRAIPVGSDSSLALQAKSQIIAGNRQRILVVWDGDVQSCQAEQWLKKEKLFGPSDSSDSGVNWIFLPGDCSPERWVLDVLASGDGYTQIAQEFGTGENEAEELVTALSTLQDHHDLGWSIEERWGIPSDEALQRLAQCVAKLPGDPLGSIRDAVKKVLEGQLVRGGL